MHKGAIHAKTWRLSLEQTDAFGMNVNFNTLAC